MGEIIDDIEIPKWDVALEALVREEFQKKASPLKTSDFKKLANEYSIRLDDIMATMLALCVNNFWLYFNAHGEEKKFTEDEVENLFVAGRLHESDIDSFSGTWSPVGILP